MTSLPQTQPRSVAAEDSLLRTPPAASGAADASGAARGRARQALPAIDPSQEFGCVDWFLYPQVAAAEGQGTRVPA